MMAHADQIPEVLASHEVLASTPEVWFQVSRGLTSPEQAARELEELEDPELVERSMRLFAPPSAAQERAIRERALAAVAPVQRSRWWVAGAFAMAAAILLTLAVRPPAPPEHAALGVAYQLELSAGWEPARASSGHDGAPEEAVRRYRLDQRVSFTLRPSAALDATELDVVMLAYDEHGRGVQVGPVRRLATTTGTVRFAESLGAEGLAPGTWQLVLVVGRVGEVPEGPERFAPGAAEPDASLAVVRETIHLIGIDEP